MQRGDIVIQSGSDLTPHHTATTSETQTPITSVQVCSRPRDAFGERIGNEYVRESAEQHLKNRVALELEFQDAVTNMSVTGRTYQETKLIFLMDVYDRYNKGLITGNTFAYILVQYANTAAIKEPLCSKIIAEIENRYKQYEDRQDSLTRNTLLQVAIYAAEDSDLRFLLQCGIDPNGVNNNSETALHVAAGVSPQSIETLVQHGANVNSQRYDSATPLHVAAITNKPASVHELLNAGARQDILAETKNAKIPAVALALYNIDTLKAFIEHKNALSVNHKYGPYEHTLLYYSFALSLTDGNTPINDEVIRYLLQKGANPNIRSILDESKTKANIYPICFVVRSRPHLIPLFLEYGADINIDDSSPLAFTFDMPETFETLLELGATITPRVRRTFNANEGIIKDAHKIRELIEKYTKIQEEKTFRFQISILFTMLSLLLMIPMWKKVIAPFRQKLHERKAALMDDLLANKRHAYLNQLTDDIFPIKWQRNGTHKFSIDTKSNAFIDKDTIKVIANFLKQYGLVTNENGVLQLVINQDMHESEIKTKKHSLLAEINAIDSSKKFDPYEKRMETLISELDQLVKLKKKIIEDYQQKIPELESKINKLSQESINRNKKTHDSINNSLKTLKQREEELHKIGFAQLKTECLKTKEEFNDLKTLPFDSVRAKIESLIKAKETLVADEKAKVLDYSGVLTKKISSIEEELLKFAPKKQTNRQATRPRTETPAPAPAEPAVTPIAEPVLEAPRATPVHPQAPQATKAPQPVEADTRHQNMAAILIRPSAPVKTYEVPPTIFATADKPKQKEKVQQPPFKLAKSAHQYVCNMSAILDEILKGRIEDNVDQSIHLHGLLYNVLRLIQGLWHITLHKQEEHVVKNLRNLIVHQVSIKVGDDITMHQIVLLASHLLPAVDALSHIMKLKSDEEIIAQSKNLIHSLKLETSEIFEFSTAEDNYSKKDCILQIKRTIDEILALTQKGLETIDDVKFNLSRVAAVKLLIVRIGEYWNKFNSSVDQYHQFIPGETIELLDECKKKRNLICHETYERSDYSYNDINDLELLNIVRKFPSCKLNEPAKPTFFTLPRAERVEPRNDINDLLALQDDPVVRKALRAEILAAFEKGTIVTDEATQLMKEKKFDALLTYISGVEAFRLYVNSLQSLGDKAQGLINNSRVLNK